MSRNYIVRASGPLTQRVYHQPGNGKGVRYGSIFAVIFYGSLIGAFMICAFTGCAFKKKEIRPKYEKFSPEEWYSLGYLNGLLSASDGKDRLKNGTRR